jgi:hypothetical protein
VKELEARDARVDFGNITLKDTNVGPHIFVRSNKAS